MFINWLKWTSAGAGLAGWGNLSAKGLRSADFWETRGLTESHWQQYLSLTLPHISVGTGYQAKSYGMYRLCLRTMVIRAQRHRFTTYR